MEDVLIRPVPYFQALINLIYASTVNRRSLVMVEVIIQFLSLILLLLLIVAIFWKIMKQRLDFDCISFPVRLRSTLGVLI